METLERSRGGTKDGLKLFMKKLINSNNGRMDVVSKKMCQGVCVLSLSLKSKQANWLKFKSTNHNIPTY
jgi:hypothetical protein